MRNYTESKYTPKSTKKAFYFPKTDTKICSKCGVEKPSSQFYKHNQTKDGFHSWCKACCKTGNEKSLAKKYSTFEGRLTTLLRTCNTSAKSRNQECTLTRDDLIECWEKQEHVCAYTGIELTTQPALYNSVSVERIDSSVGYTPENTILVCNYINRMKSNFDYKIFYDLCKAVTEWLTDETGQMIKPIKE